MKLFREHRLCNAFIARKGQEVTWRPKPTNASTPIMDAAALKLASGKVAHLTDAITPFGIARKAKASSDTSEDAIPVEVLRRGTEYEVAVGTSGGTLADTTPGDVTVEVNYDNSEPDKINLSGANAECAVVDYVDLTNSIALVTFIKTYY